MSTSESTANVPLLEARGIVKRFGHVRALRGASFAVSEDYDRKGMHLRSFIPCPNCGKRHDPRNRLLTLSK